MLRVVTLARRPCNTGARDWCTCRSHRRVETVDCRERKAKERYHFSSYDYSQNEGRLLTSSLSRYLFCSPPLITFPLLILVVLLRLVRLRSRPIPFSFPVVPFFFPFWGRGVEVPPSPSRPIPLFFFRRPRIFPRNRSTVHQFRRDVVARSLEENYRVRG